MRVFHFNTLVCGGAATAVRRLHSSLGAHGTESKVLYSRRWGTSDEPGYEVFVPDYQSRNVIDRVLDWHLRRCRSHLTQEIVNVAEEGFELFCPPVLSVPTPFDVRRRLVDVLNMHWVSGLIDYPSFFRHIPRDFPVVWTLHDMYAFTGVCHYAWECDKFKTRCNECPQLMNRSATDWSGVGFSAKQCIRKLSNLHVVADSRWLEGRAKESFLLGNVSSFRTIYYGLDTNTFKPLAKEVCRRKWNIDPEAIVIAFGADRTSNRRKGLAQLLQALTQVAARTQVVCIVFGEGSKVEPPTGVLVQHIGVVKSESELASVYSAADIFAFPSLQEAFGQVALESIACGTPVVAFDTGGIPEVVRPDLTGLLARCGDVTDLTQQLRWMIDHPRERERMGREGRAVAVKEFSSDIQATKYQALYTTLLENRA